MKSQTPPVSESAPSASPNRFPPQTKYILGNEACERFSYYGMLSILTLYLKNVLQMGPGQATEVVHLFMMAVYFMPLAGGWLADKWLGRYWTILSISLFYCLGHGVLALFEGNQVGLYTGLFLIAIGSGGIKPCVSAFVGDQFGPQQQHLLPKVYGFFYWAINLGALFGFALIPLIRDKAGYSWAFGVPGIFMGLATLVFWLGTRHYVRQPPQRGSQGPGFFRILLYTLQHQKQRGPGQSFWEPARARFRAEEVAGARAVLGILMIFATAPVFWALYNQINTTWVLQGEKMTPFYLLQYKVDAERIQSAGALLVLAWVPILTVWLYPLAERWGLRPTPLRRMSLGMVLAAVAFGICALLQAQLDQGLSLSLAWQLLPYTVLTAGEVMVSATALEFAFSQAPASMKSIIMSFWLMTIALGNFLVAALTSLNRHFVQAKGAAEFSFYAVSMLLVAGIFMWCASRYRQLADRA